MTAVATRRRPLAANLDEIAARWSMTDHAIQRCQERNISPYEVLSAIADPDAHYPGNAKTGSSACYVRGDVKVAVDEASRRILTVADRDEHIRTAPRVPTTPATAKGNHMAARTRATRNVAALDEMWALVPHDEEDYRKIEVTPTLASKLLDLNTHNRPIRRHDVDEWKRKMTVGEYQPTHQGIAIDSGGVLQDGQNRLKAIVELDAPQMAWMAVGMPPENFAVIDAGRNRSYADVLALSGEKDVNVLGATLRLVWLYLNTNARTGGGGKISNVMVMDLLSKDPARFREAAHVAHRVKHAKVGLTPIAAAAGWYLIRRTNTAARTDDFFEGLITGTNLPTGDVRPLLIRKLRGEKDEGKRANSATQLALLIKAWNMWATGAQNVRAIVWKKTEPMPQVVKGI